MSFVGFLLAIAFQLLHRAQFQSMQFELVPSVGLEGARRGPTEGSRTGRVLGGPRGGSRAGPLAGPQGGPRGGPGGPRLPLQFAWRFLGLEFTF